MTDPIFGYKIHENSLAPLGAPVWIKAEQTLVCHPLDAIMIAYDREPMKRLDKAIEWLLGEAERKFDRAIASLQ